MEREAQARLTKEINLSEIAWDPVVDAFAKSEECPRDLASKLIQAFLKKLSRPLNLFWLNRRDLPYKENQIVAVLCTTIGSDSVCIYDKKEIKISGIKAAYQARIKVAPQFKAEVTEAGLGSLSAEFSLALGTKSVTVNSLSQLLLINALVIVFALLINVAALGLIFYSLAVLALFIQDPISVTAFATRKLTVWLSLLVSCIGLAFLGRRIVLDLVKRFRRLRSKEAGPINPAP